MSTVIATSDGSEAIQIIVAALDGFAPLAMTDQRSFRFSVTPSRFRP
jgi:hypothetical protein